MDLEEATSHQHPGKSCCAVAVEKVGAQFPRHSSGCRSGFKCWTFCSCQRSLSLLWTSPLYQKDRRHHCGRSTLSSLPLCARDNDCPTPLASAWPPSPGLEELLDFAEVTMLSRPAANWVRLVVLLRGPFLPWFSSEERWRYTGYVFKHYPFQKLAALQLHRASVVDFDSALGFPGEGPSWILCIGLFLQGAFGFCQWISLACVWWAGWCVVWASVWGSWRARSLS